MIILIIPLLFLGLVGFIVYLDHEEKLKDKEIEKLHLQIKLADLQRSRKNYHKK